MLLFAFHVWHEHFLAREPCAAGLMELFTWSAEGGLTDEEVEPLRRPQTPPDCSRGCSRPRGAEPARRIITSLTSPGLVVGMNNIRSSLSPPSPSRKEVRGENTRNCFIRWNINQPSVQEQNTNTESILKIHDWLRLQLYLHTMKKQQHKRISQFPDPQELWKALIYFRFVLCRSLSSHCICRVMHYLLFSLQKQVCGSFRVVLSV